MQSTRSVIAEAPLQCRTRLLAVCGGNAVSPALFTLTSGALACGAFEELAAGRQGALLMKPGMRPLKERDNKRLDEGLA